MAQRTQKQQTLRTAFDTAYRVIDSKDKVEGAVETAFSAQNARKTGLTIMSFGVIFLSVVIFFAADIVGRLVVILNLPPTEVLMETPYEVAGFNMVIAEDGAPLITLPEDGYTYLSDRTSLAIIDCLGNAMAPENANSACPLPATALASESAVLANQDKETVAIAAASYESQEAAYESFRALFEYGRLVGETGNFVIARSNPAPFFFNLQADVLNFSWTSETWVYTISAPDLNSIGEFIDALPLVEITSALEDVTSGLQ